MGACFQIAMEALDAGKLRVGPLRQQLVHHPAFRSVHLPIAGITAVPVGHSQAPPWLQHAKQFIGIALLIGHVGTCFDTPHRIEVLVGELEIEGIHHREAAAEVFRREICGALHLGWADADAQHIKAIVPGKDASTTTDAAARIQQL